MAIINDAHRCFICGQQFQAGEMVLSDVNGGLGHRACFGEDREGYADLDTGEPLAPDDPIPAGEPYDPADYPEFARNAQSEAVAAWIDSSVLATLQAGPKHGYATVYRSDEAAGLNTLDAETPVALYAHPAPQSEAVAVKPLDIADDNDGIEQDAFEAWAKAERYDMHEHPMHWLFLDAKTAAARDGWRAGIRHSRARILALTHPAPPLAVTDEMPTHRHKKRGTEYVLIGIGKMQAEDWEVREYTAADEPVAGASVDLREVAIYRSVDDGSLWVRPREEFEDGRFEALTAALEAKQ